MYVWLLETDEAWAVVAADTSEQAIKKWIATCNDISPIDVESAIRFDLIE